MRACTTAMARADERAQFDGNCAVAMGAGRCGRRPHDPVDVRRDLPLEFDEGRGDAVELAAGLAPQRRLAAWKKHLRLEDEAVADDAHVLPVAEDLAQAPEEVGAVAGELLHRCASATLRRLPRSAMRAWLSGRGSRSRERLLEGRELPAHGGDLLVQDLDLIERAARRLPFGVERRSSSAGPRLSRPPLSITPCRRALGLRGAERRLEPGEGLLRRAPARALERQKIGQLGDLAVEAVEHRVASGDLLARKNCASMKIEIRKTIASSSVDRASTKPGQ